MTQTNLSTTVVSRSSPQAHPIFLLKPIQYPTPTNPRLNQPATVIRPILSSNINVSTIRPPIVRRLLRPATIRPGRPNENVSVPVQRRTPIRESSIESSLSTLSSLSSSASEETTKKQTCCSCFPCCRTKKDPDTGKKSQHISERSFLSNPNLRLKSRTIYIIIGVLFLFFLIVIILLIVLIVVRH